jgi:putative FmdB family regulatory protein
MWKLANASVFLHVAKALKGDYPYFMPIYEYLCQKCGRHFEKRQSVSEGPLKMCEECGGQLEKQWSLSGFQFKGEGWYVTDYSSKKPGASSDTSTKDSNKSTSTESTASTDSASKPVSEKPAKSDSSKE